MIQEKLQEKKQEKLQDTIRVMQYAPYLMFDKREPFEVKGIGYTIFTESQKSNSFRRMVVVDKEKVDFVIEYAIFFDYDIQHLYELEHIWIYVGKDGNVCGCEGSYHGKVLNEMIPEAQILCDDTHVCLYSQPGKHAILPEKRCIYLYPWWKEACMEQAGADGFAYPEELYGVSIPILEEQQKRVEEYIKKKYVFVPSMEFVQTKFDSCLFMQWEVLRNQIPERMKQELENIFSVSESF